MESLRDDGLKEYFLKWPYINLNFALIILKVGGDINFDSDSEDENK